jgi:3-methyladenine DNA glycosylase AlkD
MSKPSTSNAIRRHLLRDLRAVADPTKAPQQQAYMKSDMPYLGVVTPAQRKVARDVFKAHPIADRARWTAAVLDIWRKARYREERYCAIELAGYTAYRQWLTPQAMPMLEELIVTGAWWDYVDAIAINMVGAILADNRDELTALLTRWATDDDMWRRRTAILAQLKFKARTDEALLFHAIESSMDSKEFFLRKAIGWALREYSKTHPDVVVAYVRKHRQRLSPLSKREGLKVLLKQGQVAGIP